jgi:hypothetical protein
VRAKIPAVKEPQGLVMGSGLRPDGITQIPWARGKCLAWDATVPDTFAPSHLRSTASTAGSAAEQAAVIKLQKYSVLSSQFIIMPVAVETLGSWSDDSLRFVTELGRRITEATGDNRETTFLFQRLSIAIQRGNAISCRGSFPMPL